MNNSNKIQQFIIGFFGATFLVWLFMTGVGADPSKYKNINDSQMNCQKILQDVDRVGILTYLFNGTPDAPKHYHSNRGNVPAPAPTFFQAAINKVTSAGYGNYMIILVLVIAIYGPQFLSKKGNG